MMLDVIKKWNQEAQEGLVITVTLIAIGNAKIPQDKIVVTYGQT